MSGKPDRPPSGRWTTRSPAEAYWAPWSSDATPQTGWRMRLAFGLVLPWLRRAGASPLSVRPLVDHPPNLRRIATLHPPKTAGSREARPIKTNNRLRDQGGDGTGAVCPSFALWGGRAPSTGRRQTRGRPRHCRLCVPAVGAGRPAADGRRKSLFGLATSSWGDDSVTNDTTRPRASAMAATKRKTPAGGRRGLAPCRERAARLRRNVAIRT